MYSHGNNVNFIIKSQWENNSNLYTTALNQPNMNKVYLN